MTTPSVGRVVHFREGANECQAAMVTKTWSDDLINLTAFTPDGLVVPKTSVKYAEPDDETAVGWSWHWPERV